MTMRLDNDEACVSVLLSSLIVAVGAFVGAFVDTLSTLLLLALIHDCRLRLSQTLVVVSNQYSSTDALVHYCNC